MQHDSRFITDDLAVRLAEDSAKEKRDVRVYILDKSPKPGRFIISKDHEELKLKGFLRFVPMRNVIEFERTRNEDLSQVIQIKWIADVKVF